MQRVSRLRFVILATIACVILFCIAAFSVSMAKWTLGDDSNATKVMQGKASNFYVEYPQYISGSEESEVIVPPLDNGDPSRNRPAKYYLQVPQRGNTGMSDFYEFRSHTDSEVKLESVYLYKGDVLTAYKGTATQNINSYSGLNLTLGDNVELGTGFVSIDNKKLKVETEGFYDFYYVKSSGHCYTNYVGIPSDDNNDNNQGNTIDTTGYTELFSVKFSDDTQVKKLYFKTGSNARSPYNSLSNLAVHIRDVNWNGYYYNSVTYPGSGGSGDGNMRKVSYLNKGTVDVGTKSNTVIIIGFDEEHISNSQTAAGENGISAPLDLKNYAVGEINLITLHTEKGGTPKHKSSGGSVSNPADDRTAITPDYEGTTDFNNGGTVSQTLNVKKTVRQVTSGVQESGNKYIYKNYICVSRKNSAVTDDDNSIAYLEFEVANSTVNPYNVKVTKLTLKRRATDASGNIKDRFVDPAPRIYNYDPNLDTRLGPDLVLSNPNTSNRKPLFARGLLHAANNSEGAGHMIDHYDDGVYAVLYFGDNDQQYFALDIEIELEIAAGVTVPDGGFDFTLKAQLANTNSWERYDKGYGEPWGYYMGGLINSVETWDPSRTTKLERANNRYVTDYNASLETPIVGNIETATEATINAFNERTDFNYKIIKFFDGTTLEGYARYPKGKIDVSLTVNLTEGSLIKIYMVDHDGHRLDGHTVYVVPSEIVYDTETKKLFRDETYDIYDSDLNIIIPKTGTYIFRLVGYFHTRDEEVEGVDGSIIKGDKICFEDGKRYENIPGGKNGMGLPNFNLFVDTLYITCSSAGEGNSECTITLDANGGVFNADDLKEGDTTTQITRIVTFGSDIRNLPQPTNGDKDLLGWYYEDADGNTFDFDFGSAVTGNMTLKAKWEANYWVTFNANGGALPTLPSGVTNPIQTDEYGNLTKAQWDAFKPTYSGHKFLGWYTAAEGGTKLNTSTTFTANRIVYAHWEELSDGVFINGDFAMALTNKDSNEVQALAVKITTDTAIVTVKYNQADCSQPKTDNAFKDYYTSGVGVTLGRGEYDFYYKHSGGNEGLWIVGRLEIVFNANGGKFSDDTTSKKATTGEVANATSSSKGYLTSSAIPSNPTNADTHYTFGGWNTKADGSGTPYASVTTTTGFSSGMTLYAQWTKSAFDISFDLNGATGTAPASITTNNSGKLTSLPSTEPTRSGYHFAGWYTAQTGGNKVTTTSNNSFSSDTTLYAHWDKAFTITFNAGSGGSVNPTSATANATTGKLASLPTPNRTGYHFIGWFTAASGGEQITTNTEFTENKTVYAHWDKQFTITFNAGSGTLSGSSTLTTDPDTGTLSGQTLPTATRTNYRFKGWFTATSDGTEITTAYAFAGNTTVHAQWDQLFTITFDANGSGATVNPTSATTVATTGKLASLPTPNRTGYRFDYWQTEANGGTKITTGTVFGRDTTIYAKWVEQVTVWFHSTDGSWTGGTTEQSQDIDKGSTVAEPLPADRPTAPTDKEFDCWSTTNSTSGGTAFNFGTAINAEIHLYAQWKEVQDDGLYVNGSFVKALSANPKSGVSATRFKVEDVELKANDVLTFRYNGQQITSHMYVRGGSGKSMMSSSGYTDSATSYQNIKVTKDGLFSIYYEDSNDTSNNGLWIEASAAVYITFGGANNKVTLYLRQTTGDGDKCINADDLNSYALYTFSEEAFGNWSNSVNTSYTNNGILKQNMSSTQSLPKGWIFRWGNGYGSQTKNIEDKFAIGKTYVVTLPKDHNGAADVKEYVFDAGGGGGGGDDISVTWPDTNAFGIKFNDGYILLDGKAWNGTNRPPYISINGGNIKSIQWFDFITYDMNLSQVTSINLGQSDNGSSITNSWTGIRTTSGLVSGKMYTIRYGYFDEAS